MKNSQYKIGMFGSAEGAHTTVEPKVEHVVREIVRLNGIIINGATTGISRIATIEAAKLGGKVWGFSAGTDVRQHLISTPNDDISLYTKLIFVPRNYAMRDNLAVCRKYRNVTSTATCDAGIIFSGRWGSLNEFTNLFDMGKVVGILAGTGGMADEIPQLLKKVHKKSHAVVIVDTNPVKLVDKIFDELKNRRQL